MIKILFICHGNICRSPMAEFIMKKIVAEKGVADQFFIASAATSDEEIWGSRGNPVYPAAKEELLRHGIHCEGKYAVQVTRSDYEKYDYLICMESYNISNLKWIIPEDPEHKIYRLLDFTDFPGNISDPWYTGDFKTVYQQIEQGCKALYQRITQG